MGHTRRPRAMDQTRASSSSLDPSPRSTTPAGARVRQSVLYSDRPWRSRRSISDKLPIEQNVVKVSGIEGPTVTALPVKKCVDEVSSRELEAQTMHQSPPTLVSTPSIEEYASEVRALKLRQSPPTLETTHRSKECAHDSTNSETGSETVAEKPKGEWVPWVYRPSRFDFVEATIAHAHGYSNPVQHKLDAQAFWASRKKFVPHEAPESLASLTENLAQGKASTEKIVENGKKWMGEEVMSAFKKYIERKKQFKDVLYCLGEIQQQCFNVESCDHTFHHFNFTVKTKKISDVDWSLTPYFAEVKEIHRRKYYSCFKLNSYDDGHCYACKNQGMDALQHPILGLGYEGGHAAMGTPFVYPNDDNDDYFDCVMPV